MKRIFNKNSSSKVKSPLWKLDGGANASSVKASAPVEQLTQSTQRPFPLPLSFCRLSSLRLFIKSNKISALDSKKSK